MDCGNKIADIFYAASGRVNVIVTVLVHLAEPLHSFDCLCLKLKLVSCALACCIGTTTTAADSKATAASTATGTSIIASGMACCDVCVRAALIFGVMKVEQPICYIHVLQGSVDVVSNG